MAAFARRFFGRTPLTTISTKIPLKHEFVGHQDDVWSFIFLQDNVHIVSGSSDGTMRKWDCETGLLVGEPWKGEKAVHALALSPDGKTIACGRDDGTVERWDKNGQKMQGIWTGHNDWVLSLSWSPSGQYLASGSLDGTLLIRKGESGEVEVGPIETNQGYVLSTAYSPSGDRIASGGNKSICIWDCNTGEVLQIVNDLRWVTCIVWSLDGNKLYSPARVFDSTSGTELHRFQDDANDWLYSVAISPEHNLLAGVGSGIAQLWDTESYQPLGQPLYHEDRNHIYAVSFSPDGQYLAYGGEGGKVTLRMVKNTPELPVPPSSTDLQSGATQEPISESPSDLDVTNSLGQSAVNDVDDDPYKTAFFTSSHSSPPPSSPSPTPTRRFKSRRIKLLRRALLNSPLHALAYSEPTSPTSKEKSRTGYHNGEHDDVNHPETLAPGAANRGNDKGKRREEPFAHMQTSTGELSSPAELHSDANLALWTMFRARKKDSKKATAKVSRDPSPKVVEVSAIRVPKGHAVLELKHKKKSAAQVPSAPTRAGGSSQAGLFSQGGTVHPQTFSGGQAGPSSQPESWQATGVNHTNDDTDSDWGTEGCCNVFLDKICYPSGH